MSFFSSSSSSLNCSFIDSLIGDAIRSLFPIQKVDVDGVLPTRLLDRNVLRLRQLVVVHPEPEDVVLAVDSVPPVFDVADLLHLEDREFAAVFVVGSDRVGLVELGDDLVFVAVGTAFSESCRG